MRIDASYSPVHRLSDGTEVRLRLLHPSDRDKLAAGFRRLSPQSRYRRFFSPMPRLSDRLLRHLTETDDWNHLAIFAEPASQNAGESIGVARFVRLEDAPDTAEASVAVIDAMQRRGLGRLLLTTLVQAARERGIRKFRATVLPDNEPVKQLLRSLDDHSTARIEDGLRVYELALPEPSPEALSADPIYRLFKLVAAGLQAVVRSLATPLKRQARRPPRDRRSTDPPS
jgi:RimJ/RimL family protein N-acetyltransferase